MLHVLVVKEVGKYVAFLFEDRDVQTIPVKHSLTNQLGEDSDDQVIKWAPAAGVLVLGWNKHLQPDGASLFLEVTGLVLTYSLFYKRDKNITN